MAINNTKIHIGTSGWSYNDWTDGVFYPPDISNKDWLKFYSSRFSTVEINATFYHQMSAKTYKKWHDTVPDNFIFSVKISRFLTHIKKLNDPKEPWQRFINNAKMLKEKLGPVLVQLSPNFKVNCDKLKNLLKIIPKKYKIAFEFRHETWFCDEVYEILKKHNAVLVFADPFFAKASEGKHHLIASFLEGVEMEITADFIYIRMHGPKDLYSSKYTIGQLKKLADKIKIWNKKVKNIYVYFNNDMSGYAVENALELRQLVNITNK